MLSRSPSEHVGPSSRLFVALWPSLPVRQELQSWQQGWRWPSRASPVTPDSLHLTLHFLGEVADARIPALRQHLHVPFSSFELCFSQATIWNHGIAALLPDSVPQELLALQAALGDVLQQLGLQIELRPYRPHVTLARRAERATPPAQGPLIRWPVSDYFLMLSRPGRSRHEPSGYSVLESFSL